MFFSVGSVQDSKYPAEMVLHKDGSGGKSKDPCRKYSLSMEVNCCRFALRIFLGFHIRGLAISVTCILEVGNPIAFSIGAFYLCAMHFILLHTVRLLSSRTFPTDVRAGLAFEGCVWHVLFLLEIAGRFSNEPYFVGAMVLPLVRCMG